jgi:hypothetical protein
MVYQIPKFLEVAFIGFQILLSFLILCYFLKNRIVHKKLEDNLTGRSIGPNFEAAFVQITLQQRIYQAFANILDTITVERTGLEKILENHAESHFDENLNNPSFITWESENYGKHQQSENYGKQSNSEDRVERKIRENSIRKFSSKGLNPQKISETLKIPLNEVELILNLEER